MTDLRGEVASINTFDRRSRSRLLFSAIDSDWSEKLAVRCRTAAATPLTRVRGVRCLVLRVQEIRGGCIKGVHETRCTKCDA